MNIAEFIYSHPRIEALIPESGTAQEVADALAKNPEFVALIQAGIDESDPNPQIGGKTFKQSIAQQLAWPDPESVEE